MSLLVSSQDVRDEAVQGPLNFHREILRHIFAISIEFKVLKLDVERIFFASHLLWILFNSVVFDATHCSCFSFFCRSCKQGYIAHEHCIPTNFFSRHDTFSITTYGSFLVNVLSVFYPKLVAPNIRGTRVQGNRS